MSVLLETSAGDIVVDLLTDHAPTLCENFLKLCKTKYYNFSPIHTVQKNYSLQTGDPLGPLSAQSDGGSSIWGNLGTGARTFEVELHPKLKHAERGTVSMATVPSARDPDKRMAASQFMITLGEDTDFLDGKGAIFGKVVEGFDALEKINDAVTDEKHYPLIDIRIKHTVILDDPYPDPPGLREPSSSPPPTDAQLQTVRIADEAELHANDDISEEELERRRAKKDAESSALMLELMGDLPFAEVKPPENVLFVCKLNPVTQSSDLELIFGRFGKILSCEIIRDAKTGDSLQYAFIEFADKQACEMAYFKMQDVLIDDRRIHVDFSQSVAKLSDAWRGGENKKRRQKAGRGGWGGVEELEKKRQYREEDDVVRGKRYQMVADDEPRGNGDADPSRRDADKSRDHRRSGEDRRRRGDDRSSLDDRRARNERGGRLRSRSRSRSRSPRRRYDDRRGDRVDRRYHDDRHRGREHDHRSRR